MPYLIIYYEKTLLMADYVFIMAPAIILASIATAFYGRAYDKFGFYKSIIAPLVSLAIGYVLLFFFKEKALVFIGSLLMMCGYLCGAAIFGANIRDLTPENKAGMFQGIRIIGQVLIPGVIGPIIGSYVLKDAETIIGSDGTESFLPNANIFLAALIVLIVLAALITVLNFVKKSKKS